MPVRERLLQAGVFVLVVAVVVGGTAVAGTVGFQPETPDPPEIENRQFDAENALPPTDPESGSVTMESDVDSKTVLIDVGHENGFSEADAQPLVSALVANGHEVRYFSRQDRDLNASLRKADAFVTVNPRQRFTDSQVQGLRAFEAAGGRVLLVSDPAQTELRGGLFFAEPVQVGAKETALSSEFGVAFEAGYLYNMQENANNFKSLYATPSGDDPLTEGVDRVVFREAAPVVSADDGSLLTGTEGTTLSSTRKQGTYGVAATSGNVTAVGDSDFLAPENVYFADNEAFVGNLADFLVTGNKTAGAPAPPEPEEPAGPGPAPGPGPEEPPRPPEA